MSKHTPGPWAPRDLDSPAPYIVADQGKHWSNPVICNMYDDVTPEDSVTIGPWLEPHTNAVANARLIAAAPELLDALQRVMDIDQPITGTPTHAQLVEYWEYEKSQGRGEADDRLFALAAIAKATGEQA